MPPVLSTPRESVKIEDVRVSHFDWDKQTQTVWATISNQRCVHLPAGPPLVRAIARRPHMTTVDAHTSPATALRGFLRGGSQ